MTTYFLVIPTTFEAKRPELRRKKDVVAMSASCRTRLESLSSSLGPVCVVKAEGGIPALDLQRAAGAAYIGAASGKR